jgi:hypothetical protein
MNSSALIARQDRLSQSDDSRVIGSIPRSLQIQKFSNDFENEIGSIGRKRQKATMQVQNTPLVQAV